MLSSVCAGGQGQQRAQRADLTNTVVMSGDQIEVRPEVSTCILDPLGGARIRHLHRKRLIAFAATIPRGRGVSLTLTLDRNRFAGPLAAYLVVRPKITDLMRRLFGEHPEWGGVLEFQEGSGDGWPHWHIIARLPRGAKLKALRDLLWRIWKDEWGFARAGLDLSKCRTEVGTAVYLCKYMTKAVSHVPAWVLDLPRCPRTFAMSKAAVARLPIELRPDRSKPSRHPERKRPLVGTVGSRLARSGSTVAIVRRRQIGQGEGARWRVDRLASGVPCPWREVPKSGIVGITDRPMRALRLADGLAVSEAVRELSMLGAHLCESVERENHALLYLAWEERHAMLPATGAA